MNPVVIHNLAENIEIILNVVVQDQRDIKSVLKAFAKEEGKDINDPNFEGLGYPGDIFKIVFACSDSKNWLKNIKIIINAIIPEQRTFIYVIEKLAVVMGVNIDDFNAGKGFLDAKDAMIIALYCSDCKDFIKNYLKIFKVIKSEQKEQKNIISILDEIIKENINNCQDFLDIENEDLVEIINNVYNQIK